MVRNTSGEVTAWQNQHRLPGECRKDLARKPGLDPGSGPGLLRDFPRSLRAASYSVRSHLAELARPSNYFNALKSLGSIRIVLFNPSGLPISSPLETGAHVSENFPL